jgi:hypothetical protein
MKILVFSWGPKKVFLDTFIVLHYFDVLTSALLLANKALHAYIVSQIRYSNPP